MEHHQDSHWLISAGLVTSSIIAITANSFLLLIFCRRRGLRTVPNRFVINLLVTNLLSSILLIPLLIADQETPQPTSLLVNTTSPTNGSVEIEDYIFIHEKIETNLTSNTSNLEIIETSERLVTGSVTRVLNLTTATNTSSDRNMLCYSAQSSTTFVCTLSILSILLIGVNQYFGVIHSLRYHFYINKCRSTVFIITTWVVALLFGVLSSVTHSDSTLWRFCRKKSQNSDTVRIFNTVYAVSYFVVVILAPFAAICVIYMCIYTAAHNNSERMRKSTSANLESYIQVAQQEDGEKPALPKVRSAPSFTHFVEEQERARISRTISERNPQNSFITSLKHKISNASASVFRYREETRAAKISVLVIFLVLICYIPYGLTLVLNSDLVRMDTSRHFNYLSLILLVFSNIISPFLFAYRNKRVKREIGKLFGLVPPRSPNKLSILDRQNRRQSAVEHTMANRQPFLAVPEVIVTCKMETERKSILKRVYNSSGWSNCKKCNFITVPDSCISAEARGSFSSASTQISSED